MSLATAVVNAALPCRRIVAVNIVSADPTLQHFKQLLTHSLEQKRWLRLLLAKPQGAEAGLQRVMVRPLVLKGLTVLSFVYSYTTRDITKNLPLPEGLARIDELMGCSFRNAHLTTPDGETQLVLSRKGKAQLSVHGPAHASARPGGADRVPGAAKAPVAEPGTLPQGATASDTPAATVAHDRPKQRWLDINRPFLVALGVTTAQHQLVPAMARKWKQINKFVEIFAHALASSGLKQVQQIRVVDFGAGKAYLSFAVHDWLRHTQGLQAEVVAVELREDLVAHGQRIVSELGLQGMRLEQGDVRQWRAGPMNVMMALHACDTATDHAIHLGIRGGAEIILCSPCCHKQLRPQLLSPHPLRSVFQHGIHAEQQAEMVTDSLRALLLDAHGYDTQVFEFVALEHTRKNKMILAVKRRVTKAPAVALAQVQELKLYFGVREQCLESLLSQPVVAP